MITGAHSIIYSTNADADRAFLKDILQLTNVDVGGGWLIFGLPPAEVAVHPGEENNEHELYLMTDDIEAFVDAVGGHGVQCSPRQDQGWGILTDMTLPGGGKLGVYQPRHARPPMPGAKKAAPRKAAAKKKAPARKAAAKKKPAKKGRR